jgi:hypothetical protein
MDANKMTKGERDDLIRLVKQREKVAKTSAEQRSAAMLADFEAKITALHDFDDDAIWSAAVKAAIDAAKKANAEIAKQSTKLGIPKEFQLSLNFNRDRRGQAEYKQRREELRRLAKAEIDALEKVARVQIESESVRCQTEIIANGLNSSAAREFLDNLPKIESLMPPLDVSEIQQKLSEQMRKSNYRGPYLIE